MQTNDDKENNQGPQNNGLKKHSQIGAQNKRKAEITKRG